MSGHEQNRSKQYEIFLATGQTVEAYKTMHLWRKYENYKEKDNKKKKRRQTSLGTYIDAGPSYDAIKKSFKNYVDQRRQEQMDMVTGIYIKKKDDKEVGQFIQYQTKKEAREIIKDNNLKRGEYIFAEMRRSMVKYTLSKLYNELSDEQKEQKQKEYELCISIDATNIKGDWRGKSMFTVMACSCEQKKKTNQNMYLLARFITSEHHEIMKEVFVRKFNKYINEPGGLESKTHIYTENDIPVSFVFKSMYIYICICIGIHLYWYWYWYWYWCW